MIETEIAKSTPRQTVVEVAPHRPCSVASQRTRWGVFIQGDRTESFLVKAKAREKAKEIATEENAMYRVYRIEPGVPIGLSVSDEIDYRYK